MNPIHVGISSESGLWNCKSGDLRVESFHTVDDVDGSEIQRSPVDMVVYPIIYDGFCTSQVVIAGFLNHQQYLTMVGIAMFLPLVFLCEHGFHIVCLKMDVFN